jgi:hypothetical protein
MNAAKRGLAVTCVDTMMIHDLHFSTFVKNYNTLPLHTMKTQEWENRHITLMSNF